MCVVWPRWILLFFFCFSFTIKLTSKETFAGTIFIYLFLTCSNWYTPYKNRGGSDCFDIPCDDDDDDDLVGECVSEFLLLHLHTRNTTLLWLWYL